MKKEFIMLLIFASIVFSSANITLSHSRQYYTANVYINSTTGEGTYSNPYDFDDLAEAINAKNIVFQQPWNSSMEGDVWTEGATGDDSYNTDALNWTWEGNNVTCITDTVDVNENAGSVKCTVTGANPYIQIRMGKANVPAVYIEGIEISQGRYLNVSFESNDTNVGINKINIYDSYYTKPSDVTSTFETDMVGRFKHNVNWNLGSWKTFTLDRYNMSELESICSYRASYGGENCNDSKNYMNHYFFLGARFYLTGASVGDVIHIDGLRFWQPMEIEKQEHDSYFVNTKIVNDAGAWIKDKRKNIYFQGTNTLYNFQCGEYDSTTDTTKNGCVIGMQSISPAIYYTRQQISVSNSSFYDTLFRNYDIYRKFGEEAMNIMGMVAVGSDAENVTFIDDTFENSRGERGFLTIYAPVVTLKRVTFKESYGEAQVFFQTEGKITAAGIDIYSNFDGYSARGISLHHGYFDLYNITKHDDTNYGWYNYYGPTVANITDYSFEKSLTSEEQNGWEVNNYAFWNNKTYFQTIEFEVTDEEGNPLNVTATATDSFGNEESFEINGSLRKRFKTSNVLHSKIYSPLTQDAVSGTNIVYVQDNSQFTSGMTVSLVDSKPEYYKSGSYKYTALTVDSTGENSTGKWVNFTSTYSGSYWKTSWGAMLVKRPVDYQLTNYAPYNITITKNGYQPYKILNFTPTANYPLKIKMHGTRDLYPINARIISGTQYSAGDTADLEVEVLDAYGQPVDSATCSFTVYYPDKTTWLNSIGTAYLNYGVYYNNSETVPSTTGIYTYSAQCNYNSYSAYASKYFQVR